MMAAGGDHGMIVEAAVGPHGEWSGGAGIAHAAHHLPQEVVGAQSRVGSPWRSRAISTYPVSAATANNG